MTANIASQTARIIWKLYANGAPDKAVLASLRGVTSLNSTKAQAVWPVLMATLEAEQLSKTGDPTYAETAVFAALRMYANHQQGNEISCVYGRRSSSEGTDDENGVTLFTALAQLRADGDNADALDRRIRPILAATNVASVINSLNHLVGIVKATKKPFRIDYAALAYDLYQFQLSYEAANKVRLRWGQDYFWVSNKSEKVEGESNND